MNIYRTKLDAVNRLNVAQAVRKQTLEDGQKVGTALLWAEAKLGELLANIDLARGAATQRGSPGGTALADLGISRKQSHFAQQLSVHKDLIEESIREAVENEDIPTRSLVLQKIKMQEQQPKPPAPPREEATDTGPWTCAICKERFHLLHHPNGRHEFEPVEVIEK